MEEMAPGMSNMTFDAINRTIICLSDTIYRTNGVWEGPNPLAPILPIYLFQLPLCIFATRLFVILLKPFNMPSFVGELIGGILLGPTFFGKISPSLYKWFFPTYGLVVLEPLAHFALIYYAFLMGLMLDIQTIRRTGTRALGIAVSGTVIPFVLGATLFFLIVSDRSKVYGCLFWGFALTVSGFNALTQILEKQSVIHTEIGKLSIASAQASEIISWGLLGVGLAVANSAASSVYAIGLAILFVFICLHGIRRALVWIIKQTPEGQGYSEFYLCFILSGVALCGVVTDAIGTHPMLGAFLFGLIIPNEELQTTLVERLEDFVMAIFMPGFFAVCGIRTNLDSLTNNGTSWVMVAFLIFLLSGSKIISAVFASYFTNISVREATTIGLLTSTKSILALIIVEVAQEHGVLTTQEYSVMVVAVLLMTMVVPPITIIYHPNDNIIPYKRKTIQKSKDEELRVLACVHGMRNVPCMISLLEASNAGTRSPISVYALQLVELVGRASAMLVVHTSRKSGSRSLAHIEGQTEQIISAFDNYELRGNGVMVQALTARCAYSSMDEDICNIAKDKRAAVIILPFHKQQGADGEMEDINPAIRNVNENVLANAPCSVGVLIDRRTAETCQFPRRVAALFFGGPDDREALAYAWRMSEHENVSLKVVRFVPGKEVMQADPMDFIGATHGAVSVPIDAEKEKMLDEDYLTKFKTATENESSVVYQELVLNDEEETITAIKAMDGDHDLFIVGKGRGVVSPLTAGLADWCDCPELGPIGDLFATSEFASSFSVVVMQQYVRSAASREGSEISAESLVGQESAKLDWRPSNSENDEPFGSFSHHHLDRELDH